MTALLPALLLGLACWLLVPAPDARLDALGRQQRRRPEWWAGIRTWWEARRGPRHTHGLPEALELLAVCLDAGRPLASAVPLVADVTRGDVHEWLGRVQGRLILGQTGARAWEGNGEVGRQVAREVGRAERSGTQLAPVLRELAADLRSDAAERDLAAARRVGVKSVLPLVLCFLPAFVLVGVVPIIAGLLGRFVQ